MRNCDYEEFINRDKVNLDIFWLKDDRSNTQRIFPPQKSSPRKSWKTSFERICRDCDGFGWRRETAGVSQPVKVDA